MEWMKFRPKARHWDLIGHSVGEKVKWYGMDEV